MATGETSHYVRSTSLCDSFKGPAVTLTLSPSLPRLAYVHVRPPTLVESGPVTAAASLQSGQVPLVLPLNQICGSQSLHRQLPDCGSETLDFPFFTGEKRRSKKHRKHKSTVEQGCWAVAMEAALTLSTSDPFVSERNHPYSCIKHSDPLDSTGEIDWQPDGNIPACRLQTRSSRWCSSDACMDGDAVASTISAWTVVLSVGEGGNTDNHCQGGQLSREGASSYEREAFGLQSSPFCIGGFRTRLSPAAASQTCNSSPGKPDCASCSNVLVTTPVDSRRSQGGAVASVDAVNAVAGYGHRDTHNGGYQHLGELGQKLRQLRTCTALTGQICLDADVDTQSHDSTHTAVGCDDCLAVTPSDGTGSRHESCTDREQGVGAGAVERHSGSEIEGASSDRSARRVGGAAGSWLRVGSGNYSGNSRQGVADERQAAIAAVGVAQCDDKVVAGMQDNGGGSIWQEAIERADVGGRAAEVEESFAGDGWDAAAAPVLQQTETPSITRGRSDFNLPVGEAAQAGRQMPAEASAQRQPDVQLARSCSTKGAGASQEQLMVCPLPSLFEGGRQSSLPWYPYMTQQRAADKDGGVILWQRWYEHAISLCLIPFVPEPQ